MRVIYISLLIKPEFGSFDAQISNVMIRTLLGLNLQARRSELQNMCLYTAPRLIRLQVWPRASEGFLLTSKPNVGVVADMDGNRHGTLSKINE